MSAGHDNALELREVSKTYDGGRTHAVDTLNLTAKKGELIVVLGGSGCGKTTTLKMINRLIEPTSGSIRIDGREVTRLNPVRLRRSIGYIFQGIGLFPHMTVAENVGITPRLMGWEASMISKRVDELLEMVHLPPDDYRDRKPSELSGGQRQRVGFARALAAEPSVVLMDEAFGALDPITRDRLQAEFREIQRDLHLTSLLVTHDMTEALLMADRIAVMNEGRIVQVGTPHELMSSPKNAYVEELIDTPKRQAGQLEQLAEEAS